MSPRLERIRLRRVDMPLVRPFRTSFGTQEVRDILLVEAITSDGISGWGECVAMSWPGYSYEYVDGCIDVLTEHLIPLVLPDGVLDPVEAHRRLSRVMGHPMAKTALETAILDAWLRTQGVRLVDYLGAAYPGDLRDTVDCGVSVGIPPSESISELLDEVAEYVEAGYRRIKCKIEPGWDVEPIRAVRESWPDMLLQTDANQAFTLADAPVLAAMDPFDLLLVEQPDRKSVV